MKNMKFIAIACMIAGLCGFISAQDSIQKDLGKDATLEMSSSIDEWCVDKDFLLKDGKRTGQFKDSFAFTTAEEENPYIIMTLPGEATINRIYIQNRVYGCQERAKGLTIWFSTDNKEWKQIWKAENGDPEWNIELNPPVKAKYIKLGLNGKVALHLNKVRIYGN